MHTIVVIGAGFSGVMVAAHLLRVKFTRPLRIVMINRSGMMARGVAYGTNSPLHLLNVPAGRMSAFPDDPEHFLRFVRERDPAITPSAFVSRAFYGQYLQQVLADAESAAPPNSLVRLISEAVSVELEGGLAWVTTATGERLSADHVVLAIGHYPPAHPPCASAEFLASPRYVRDPWAPGALSGVPRDQMALLVGTGLTALDVALELHSAGLPRVVAVSRRGLLPRAHDPSVSGPGPTHLPAGLSSGSPTLRAYLKAVRHCIREATANGGDWRQVIDALRPHTPRLWRSLNQADREQFFRHLRAYWDVHRHRVAPAVAEAVRGLVASGWLKVRAGRLTQFVESAEGIEVRARPQGGGAEEALRVGAVVNCTGPAANVNAVEDPLLAHLFSRGLARRDGLGLGFDVAEDGALIGAEGQPFSRLHYVGPFLRARDGEGTAVPELRVHAARVAEAVVQHLSRA